MLKRHQTLFYGLVDEVEQLEEGGVHLFESYDWGALNVVDHVVEHLYHDDKEAFWLILYDIELNSYWLGICA